MPIPKKIQNAPELLLGLQLFYMAFLDLSSSRLMGMEEGYIPWGAIQEYGCHLELSEDQMEDLHYHVFHLDQARASHSKRKGDKADGKSGNLRSPNGAARKKS